MEGNIFRPCGDFEWMLHPPPFFRKPSGPSPSSKEHYKKHYKKAAIFLKINSCGTVEKKRREINFNINYKFILNGFIKNRNILWGG